MRPIRLVAQPPTLVFLIGLEIALEPFYVAVALEGQDVGREPIQEEAVVADHHRAAGEILQRILERAALVTALLLLIRRTAGEAENRVRGELLEELLGASVRDPDGVRERARRLGADLDRPHAVLVARVEEHLPRALAAATHLAVPGAWYVAAGACAGLIAALVWEPRDA